MLEITKESQASPSLGAKLSKMRLKEVKNILNGLFN